MKKKSYMTPAIRVQYIDLTTSILAGSNETQHDVDWNPRGSQSTPTQVIEEGDGNLGDEGSEITGAKKNSSWSDWD